MALGDLLQKLKGAFGGGNSSSGESPAAGAQGGLDQDKALAYVRDRWSDLKNAYVVYHQAIWQSLLFYANQSWIDWDDARKVWQPNQPSDEWVPRPRINRFSPTMDAMASNFFQLPEVEAVAKCDVNDAGQSHVIADLSTELIEYAVGKEGLKHQQNEEEDKVGLAAQLFVLEGSVFSILRKRKKSLGSQAKSSMQPAFGYQCPTCDKYTTVAASSLAPDEAGEAGPPKFCPECATPVTAQPTETLQPDLDEAGQPLQQELNEWEIACDIGNALNAFPRPGATSMRNSPYLLWAERLPLDTIFFDWNFEAEADAEWPDGYSVTYEHALNFWYTGYSSSALQVKDSCMVKQLYIAPGRVKDFPDGFHGVVINDKPVNPQDWEWDYPEHPITLGKYLTLPTLFFGRAVSFDAVELQRENNSYESLIKLHAMVAAVDPWVVDEDAQVNEITGRADKIIKYRKLAPDTEPPHRAGHGSLDDGVYKQRDSLHAELQNVSMATNAFQGKSEYAGEPAAAAKLRRDQAETMFGKPAANWRNFWRETLRKYVLFLQKYSTYEQLAEILGPSREQDIRAFMSANLDNTVEWVAGDQGLPRTRDELRQEMMELFDKGALDVQDPAVQRKIHELFGETGMKQAFSKHATNARLENLAFKVGVGEQGPLGQSQYVPPKIQPQPLIEDMQVHLYFHKDQAISQDFKKWPQLAQQALIEHIMQTQMAIQQQMMAMAGAAPGQPAGGKPGMHPMPQPPNIVLPGAPPTSAQGQNPQAGPPVQIPSA